MERRWDIHVKDSCVLLHLLKGLNKFLVQDPRCLHRRTELVFLWKFEHEKNKVNMTSFQHFSKNSFSANGTERNGIERNGTKRNATEGTDILKKFEVAKATWLLQQTQVQYKLAHLEKIERTERNGKQWNQNTYLHLLNTNYLFGYGYQRNRIERNGTESNGTKRPTYELITCLGITALIHLYNGTERNIMERKGKQWIQKTYLWTNYLFGYDRSHSSLNVY